MSTVPSLSSPLQLPCGVALPNRFGKSAMSEGMGTLDNRVTPEIARLYRRWAEGRVGLVVTGNVMVDRHHLGEPGNVALEDARDMSLLKLWAASGSMYGTQLWMQLNHPGKQSPRLLTREPVAPSATPLSPKLRGFFNPPRELAGGEIEVIIGRFARSARLAKEAGFGGVQIHGAHGYLVSQFLSPRHNERTDRWGGSLENRARFALEILRAIRQEVGAGFPVGIKMNSADFQRGGFTEEESMVVAEMLADGGLDLLEISGGTYEAPEMTGVNEKESTRQREAYFLRYAEQIRKRVSIPLMVTGGFRTAQGMADAVHSGATDIVGLGRSLVVEPDLCARVLKGEAFVSRVRPRTTGIKMLDETAMMETVWYTHQLQRMGAGKNPRPDESPLWAFVRNMALFNTKGLRTRRLRANH
ncbi:Predicted NADH:flavin oxidoreductase [gamma proteobacterium HdN1]|nr:Predicted NADH:flavin oxidoreductase [gamma proteobacterium HdN1]